MGLKIVMDQNLWCPQVVCDYCNKRIVDTDKALFGWYPDSYSEGSQYDVVFLHKGVCDRGYQHEHQHDHHDMSWEEMGRFTKYLERNLETPEGSSFAEDMGW